MKCVWCGMHYCKKVRNFAHSFKTEGNYLNAQRARGYYFTQNGTTFAPIKDFQVLTESPQIVACTLHTIYQCSVKKSIEKRLIFQSWRKENHAPNICLLFVKGDDLALKTKRTRSTVKKGFSALFVPLWNKTRVKRSRSKCTFL